MNLFPAYSKSLSTNTKAVIREDFIQTDRMMLGLMVIHWGFSLFLSWAYGSFFTFALIAGALPVGISFLAYFTNKGGLTTRMLMATNMMIFSAIFIQQSMGSLSMHLHVFVALGIMIRYKDILPIVTATLVIAVHHLALNYCQQNGIDLLGSPVVIFETGASYALVFLHAGFVIAGLLAYSYIILLSTINFIANTDIVETLKSIANEKDFTLRLTSTDPATVGVQDFLTNLQGILLNFKDQSVQLSASTEELSIVSQTINESYASVSQQTGNISSASEQIFASISTMADSAEAMNKESQQMNQSSSTVMGYLGNVIQAIRGFSDSITEITNQSSSATNVALNAQSKSAEASEKMSTLATSAQEIGEVTAMIKEIAQQTNLLALNANIEAASAGEAGKGFAVVANEIKELANQSAKAAEDIAKKITGIQGDTKGAVSIIEEVNQVIQEIAQGSKEITLSAEEQAKSVNGMSNTINQAESEYQLMTQMITNVSKNARLVAANATELTTSTREISQNIQQVDLASQETAGGASQVKTESFRLAEITHSLRSTVEQYRLV